MIAQDRLSAASLIDYNGHFTVYTKSADNTFQSGRPV